MDNGNVHTANAYKRAADDGKDRRLTLVASKLGRGVPCVKGKARRRRHTPHWT